MLLTQESIEPGVSTCNNGYSSCTVTTSYTYDGFGHRITTTVYGTGIVTRTSYAAYDSLGEFQFSATNALGQSESWAYDARFGGPASHTGPNGLTTTWTYDTFGRQTLETRPDGTKTATTSTGYAYCSGVNGGSATCPTYGAYLAQAEIFASDGATQIGSISTTTYDMLSRPIANDTQGFDSSTIRVSTQYDGNGRVQQTSRPYFAIAPPCSGSPCWTSYSYDALGRVTQATMPDSSVTNYCFGGLYTWVKNNLGQTTETIKNAQGLNASVTTGTFACGTDGSGSNPTTSYVYDAFGNVLTVTDPAGNVFTNTYDIRGNKVASNDPDMGSWSYAYDVLAELTSQTDAKSQTTSLTYDVLGRALTRTENSLYGAWIYGTSAVNHNVGQIIEAKACPTSACSSIVSDKTYLFDGVGRESLYTLQTSTDYFAYTTAYNASNGQVASVAYPSGFLANRTYNTTGFLARLTDASGVPIWTINSRDAELHITSQTAGNNITTTQTFDPNTGLIQNQQAGGGGVASFNYSFDTIGNLTSRTDNVESYTERFCYDSLNRLTNYNMGSACTGGTAVGYDALGNITSKSDTGTYGYNGTRPHAVSSISGTVDGLTNPNYIYDANGNLTCVASGGDCSGTIGRSINLTSFNMAGSIDQGSNSLSLTYDDQHQRLQQVNTVSGTTTTTTIYLNDPASGTMGQRVSVAGTTPTDWGSFNWGSAPWGGTTASALPTWVDYITIDGQIVAQRNTQYPIASAWGSQNWGSFNWGTPPGNQWGSFNWGAANWSGTVVTWAYFTLDHLGSVAVIADQSGNVLQRLSYDAWGKQRNPNGSAASCGAITVSATTRGFTDQEQMPTACLVNLNARLYDPSIGKFLAADPIVGDPFAPNAFNRYAYVLNNPLSFTDPTGYDPATETVIVTATATNPVLGAVLTAIDVIADIFGFGDLFGGGGGHAAVTPHAPPAPQAPSPSVTQQPSYISGTQSGLPQVRNTLPTNNIETVIVNGQAAANSSATATQAAAYAGVGATSSAAIISAINPTETVVVTGTRTGTSVLPDLSPIASPLAQGTNLPSRYRYTGKGETFYRYESGNPNYSKIGPEGQVAPGTYAAPSSEGVVPPGELNSTYNLPDPEIDRLQMFKITPPEGTLIVGPQPVSGGLGNEVIFPAGAPPGSVMAPATVIAPEPVIVEPIIIEPVIIP